MKTTLSFLVFTLLAAVASFAFEPQRDDDSQLRSVFSFDVAPPAGHPSNRPKETWTYTAQNTLERMLTEKERETYLQESYFNGTSEAKAYALLGLYFIGSPLFPTLKADFLRYEQQMTIRCRVSGLHVEESPSAIIAAIESGALPSCIQPKSK